MNIEPWYSIKCIFRHLDLGKKIIVGAVPQLWEHGLLDRESHFEEIQFVAQCLYEMKVNVLISLHPKMEPSNYNFLTEFDGFNICADPLVSFMPIGDLFISSYSSTALWALCSGIVTIIPDFTKMDLCYDEFESMIKVFDRAKLKERLHAQLITQFDFSKDWDRIGRNEIFDGKTISRYIDLLKTG